MAHVAGRVGRGIAFLGTHPQTAALATPAEDARPAGQEVGGLVEPPDRRLAPTEWLAVLGLQIHDGPGNPTDPAASGVPAVLHPQRVMKLAEVVGVKRTDAHEIASLNGAEVLQAMPSSESPNLVGHPSYT